MDIYSVYYVDDNGSLGGFIGYHVTDFPKNELPRIKREWFDDNDISHRSTNWYHFELTSRETIESEIKKLERKAKKLKKLLDIE